jgi:hypothetical protein
MLTYSSSILVVGSILHHTQPTQPHNRAATEDIQKWQRGCQRHPKPLACFAASLVQERDSRTPKAKSAYC